ncbi:MAG: hypothetical protein V4456_22475 [Bacteroidota bacterium]
MIKGFTAFIIAICLLLFNAASAQLKTQQGMLLKQETNIRLGSVQIINKKTLVRTQSSIYGEFSIKAAAGDTLLFSSAGYEDKKLAVTDLQDQIIYLKPFDELPEVVIRANSVQKDLADVQKVYRSKGVFYTGDPHYYYLFLKPMTFIYENFKSEVKNARKFRKYTKKQLEHYEIAKRFNDSTIRQNVPITKDELISFKANYTPSIKQYLSLNDYDLINYIKNAYVVFKKKNISYTSPF